MSEPTLGEVLRRLDEVSRQLQDVVQQMREDRADNRLTYVRKDVYDARHLVLIDRIEDIEDAAEDARKERRAMETETRAARRQLIFLILAATIPSLLSLLVSLYRISGSS